MQKIIQYIKDSKQHIFLFAAFLSLIGLVYSPILTKNYAFADDYYYLWIRLYNPHWLSAIFAESALQARPLNGVLLEVFLFWFKSMADFVYLHAFAIFIASVLVYLIYRLLCQSGWTKIQSFFLALSFICLPPLQVVFAWTVTAFYILAMIFAFVSIKIIASNDITNESTTIEFTKRKIIFSTICFFLSLMIYQPAAMTYWLFASIFLANHQLNNNQRWQYFRQILLTFFIAAFLDLLAQKVAGICFYDVAVSAARTHLTTNIKQKIIWFINSPLVDALNFNQLMANKKTAIFSGIFILLGLWLYLKTKTTLKHNIAIWVTALFFIPLSYFPSLVVVESYYPYRTQIGLGLLIFFLALLSIKAFLEKVDQSRSNLILNIILVIIGILNLFIAHDNILKFFVLPQITESQLMRAQLRGDFGKERQLHPIYPDRKDTTAPYNVHDEFGMPSFACHWVKEPGTVLLRDEIKNGN